MHYPHAETRVRSEPDSGSGLFCCLTSNDHIHDSKQYQDYATPSSPPFPSVSTHILFLYFRALPAVTIAVDPVPAQSFSSPYTRFPAALRARGYEEAEQDVHLQFHLPCSKPVFDVDFDFSGQRCHRRIQLCRDRYTRRSGTAELHGRWDGTWGRRGWVWVRPESARQVSSPSLFHIPLVANQPQVEGSTGETYRRDWSRRPSRSESEAAFTGRSRTEPPRCSGIDGRIRLRQFTPRLRHPEISDADALPAPQLLSELRHP